MAIEGMVPVCLMIGPICIRVAVSQKESDEFVEAAMNLPFLASAIPSGSWLLRMGHSESVVPVGTLRHLILPPDKANKCLLSFDQERDWLSTTSTSTGTLTERRPCWLS